MTRDSDRFDFFVSYARADNSGEWITRFVEGVLAEHKAFSGGRELSCFFDKSEIQTGHDWEHRIHHGVAESRVFLAFISPRYFASEWCRKEWRAWIDTEIAKHVFSDGAAPVYIVKVPGFEEAGDQSAERGGAVDAAGFAGRRDKLWRGPPRRGQRSQQLGAVAAGYETAERGGAVDASRA